jgi:hypothetical protein
LTNYTILWSIDFYRNELVLGKRIKRFECRAHQRYGPGDQTEAWAVQCGGERDRNLDWYAHFLTPRNILTLFYTLLSIGFKFLEIPGATPTWIQMKRVNKESVVKKWCNNPAIRAAHCCLCETMHRLTVMARVHVTP